MGTACCAAAKDRTIVNGRCDETFRRHVRYLSPWSFRWDNRRRVAGEETPANWLCNESAENVLIEAKSRTLVEAAFTSEECNPLNSLRSISWQKYPVSERNASILRPPASDQAMLQNLAELCRERKLDTFGLLVYVNMHIYGFKFLILFSLFSAQVKELTESHSVSHPSPMKPSKAEMNLMARKRFRKRVVNFNLGSDVVFDQCKNRRVEERDPKASSSTSMTSSPGKPFIRRHCSFSSKPSRSSSENQPTQRKGF